MTIKDYSSTAASNTAINGVSIAGTAPVSNMDDGLRQIMADISNWTDSDTLASASTTDLGSVAGMYVTVSGTATITGFGTFKAGMVKFVYFSGAGQITHNATSMILPGGVDITRAAGDTATFVSEGSGNWRCVAYQRGAYTVPVAGAVIKSAYSTYTNTTSITSVIPVDDTIPQITEGTNIFTQVFTPTLSTSTLRIRVFICGGLGSVGNAVAALFVGGAANAVRAVNVGTAGAGYNLSMVMEYEYSPGTISSQTFNVRVGVGDAADTFYPNGVGGGSAGRVFGGTQACTMTIEEIAA